MLEPSTRELIGHEGVRGLQFSPDGKILASAAASGSLRFWDTQTWQERASLQTQSEFGSWLSFSHDGSLIAASTTDALYLVNVQTAAIVQCWNLRDDLCGSVMGTTPGGTLAVAAFELNDFDSACKVLIFEQGRDQPVQQFDLAEMITRAFPDEHGNPLAESYEFNNHKLRKWRLRNLLANTVVSQIDLVDPHEVGGVPCTSPRRNYLALGGRCFNSAVRWQTLAGRIITTLPAVNRATPILAFSSDDHAIAVLWSGLDESSCAVFHANSGERMWHKKLLQNADNAAISPNGRIVATYARLTKDLSFFSGTSGDLLAQVRQPSRYGTFTPDGQWYLSLSSNVVLLNTSDFGGPA